MISTLSWNVATQTLKDRLRDPTSTGDRDLLRKLQVIGKADLRLAARVFGIDRHSATGKPKDHATTA